MHCVASHSLFSLGMMTIWQSRICQRIGPPVTIMANAHFTQHFSTSTQHNFKNSENIFYFENKNLELKIMHSGKINLEEIFVFRI